MLAIESAAILGLDDNARVQFVRVFRGKGIVRTDLYPVQQVLGIGGLDTQLLELRRSDLVIQKRDRNQVLQIVIRLFLRLRPILWAERASARNVKSRLEDVAADGLDVLGCQAIVALQLEHRLKNRLTMNQRAELLHDRAVDDLKSGV